VETLPLATPAWRGLDGLPLALGESLHALVPALAKPFVLR
tara:strand:+ start:2067 stop:2186 length:120 start_codon:yes stop_codon:yes gene_type:complete